MSEVKIFNARLDDFTAEVEDGSTQQTKQIKGVLDQECLGLLNVDKYQRREMTRSELRDIWEALRLNGGATLPQIVLAMRGTNARKSGDNYFLYDDVYIVDGYQRITASKLYLDEHPGAKLRLDCRVFLDTAEPFERFQFKKLNSTQKRMSGNKMLFNEAKDNKAVMTLVGLSQNDRDFPLYKRVAWDQSMLRHELIGGLVVAKAAGQLMRRFAKGTSDTKHEYLTVGLLRVSDKIGLQQYRDNIKAFFEAIDQCWGITNIQYKSGAPWMRQSFLLVLGRIFSGHEEFWRGKDKSQLWVSSDYKRRLSTFPLRNPDVAKLCSSGGSSRHLLEQMLINHLNKGKSKHRLTPFDQTVIDEIEDDLEEAA